MRIESCAKALCHYLDCIFFACPGIESPKIHIFPWEYAAIDRYWQSHILRNRCTINLLLYDFRQMTYNKLLSRDHTLTCPNSPPPEPERSIFGDT